MSKKSIMVIALIALMLLVMSTVGFAETATQWSESYSGVYFQYVNTYGGSDWDGLRWYNANSYKVAVNYSIRLSDGNTITNLVYLEPKDKKGSTSLSSLATGARVATATISVKSVQ